MSSLSVYRKPRMKRRGGTRGRRRIPGSRLVRRVRRPNRVNRMIGAKRRYTRTGTVTKRRRRSQASGTNEYSRYLTKFGRYGKRTLRNAWRHIKSLGCHTVFRWNGVKAWNTNGYYWMSNKSVSTIRYCPVYLFNLTSCNNNAANATPMLQLKFDTTSTTYAWEAQYHTTSNGTATSQVWQYERYTHANGTPGPCSWLKWADIRMNLWGTKNKATRWCIQLVRIKDAMCDPYQFNSGAISTTAVHNNANDLYESMAVPYMFNPIHHAPPTVSNRIKVIKSWTFLQDPTTTIENDADPKVKEFRLFHRFNKLIKWDNINLSSTTVADEIDKAGFDVTAPGARNNCYAPAGKQYCLLIRALNCGEDGGVDSNTITPSFDLSVRTKHEFDAY